MGNPCNIITSPVFGPSISIISSITNANPATVTTAANHNYVSGNIVRMDIPLGFGMQQINGQFGDITVTGNTTFTITIDTTLYDVFAYPVTYTECPQCVPFAEDNSILTAAVQNILIP